MRITVLNRGGLAVYGGHYDAKNDTAILETNQGETVVVQLEYASPPSSMAAREAGISSGAISISGNVATVTLTDIQVGGRIGITATVDGAARVVNIANGQGGAVATGGADTADIPDLDAIFKGALD